MNRTSSSPEAFKTKVVKIPSYIFLVLVVFGIFQSNIFAARHARSASYPQARLASPHLKDVLSGIGLRNTAKLPVH
jgi:hypothetical protein